MCCKGGMVVNGRSMVVARGCMAVRLGSMVVNVI